MPNNDSPSHFIADVSLDDDDKLDNSSVYSADISLDNDNESNNSDISLDSSVYSANISLDDVYDDNKSNSDIRDSSDISLTDSRELNDDFYSDLEGSLSDMSTNEDLVNDDDKPMDCGKFLIYYYIIYIIFTKLIYLFL